MALGFNPRLVFPSKKDRNERVESEYIKSEDGDRERDQTDDGGGGGGGDGGGCMDIVESRISPNLIVDMEEEELEMEELEQRGSGRSRSSDFVTLVPVEMDRV